MLYNTSTTQTNFTAPSRLATLVGASTLAMFLVFGLVGTAWILVAILRNKSMRANVINLFIASLCLNDFINLFFNQTMVLVSYFAHGWVLGHGLCNFMPELNMVLVAISLWHHALIAMHRCIVVLWHIWYKQMNKKVYTALVLGGTRILPAFLSLLLYLSFNFNAWNELTTYNNKLLRCLYSGGQALRILIVVLITILVPCTVVICCFGVIFIFVRRASMRSSVTDRSRLQRELRITKMFGVVFVMFLIGYFPYVIVRMCDKRWTLSSEAYVILTVLYAGASCMNPIIFGAMNCQIREACLKSLPWRKRVPTTCGSRAMLTTTANNAVMSFHGERLLKVDGLPTSACTLVCAATKERARLLATQVNNNRGGGGGCGDVVDYEDDVLAVQHNFKFESTSHV